MFRLLSTLKTKQWRYSGTAALTFSKSLSLCSRPFFCTCVRWTTRALLDLGIFFYGLVTPYSLPVFNLYSDFNGAREGVVQGRASRTRGGVVLAVVRFPRLF